MRFILAFLIFSQTCVASAEYLSVEPRVAPTRARNPVGPAVLSFFLPGFDQYWEEQWDAGITYSLIGATGLGLGLSAARNVNQSETDNSDLGDLKGDERLFTYGLQLYMFAGELSAYHSFRTAVETLKPYGQYTFLTRTEKSNELMLAPFHFSYLVRPTTFIPLLLLATLGSVGLDPHAYMNGDDVAFVGGLSYNAGVGEEAFFRGYFFPYFRQSFGSTFWSNSAQATVFGLAHLSATNSFPIAQALMGYYLGWLTERNEWTLGQSIFVHTWWDILAIGLQVAHDNGRGAVARPVPLLSGSF